MGKSEYLNYVNGAWVPSHTEATYTVINPATGGRIAAVPQADVEDTRAAIDAARAAFDKGKWPRMTPGDRSAALFKLANLIEADMDHLAPIEVQNQGKTIKQARDADIPFSVDNLRRVPPGPSRAWRRRNTRMARRASSGGNPSASSGRSPRGTTHS